jgi:hypothetical protein
MMRIIELIYANTYFIDFKGKRWIFEKGKPKEVPYQLADRLLMTGDFVDVIMDDPDFHVSVDTPAAPVQEPILLGDTADEAIVPLNSVKDLGEGFNKLEVPTDLKKLEEIESKPKRKRRKRSQE